VAGKGNDLFDRYVQDTKAHGIDIDLEELSVFVYSASGDRQQVQARMTLGAFFSGLTIQQVWRRTLRDVVAYDIGDPDAEGSSLDSDVVCGTAKR
jgi:hypothetical protein